MQQTEDDGAIRATTDEAEPEPAHAGLAVSPDRPQAPTPAKSQHQNIRVAPAVLDAARKKGDALLRELGTSLAGLTQAEAEERARTAGPNEIAQERKQGWFGRL